MNNFRSALWCLLNDCDCQQYRMFHGENEIEWLGYATRKEFVFVKYKDGSFNNIKKTVKLQIEKI